MIPITTDQYVAIGKVAVQSSVLDREVDEYLIRLGHRPKLATLGPKLGELKSYLRHCITDQNALAEFEDAVSLIEILVERRNAVMHGVWRKVDPSAIGAVIASGRKTAVSAKKVAALAEDIRNVRMLLLRLCNEYHPIMDGGNKCPHTLSTLKARLTLVTQS